MTTVMITVAGAPPSAVAAALEMCADSSARVNLLMATDEGSLRFGIDLPVAAGVVNALVAVGNLILRLGC